MATRSVASASGRKTTAARKTHTISNAAKSGNRRRLLVAMRNRIASDLDAGRIASRDLASLTKRLMDIAAEIERIDKGTSKANPVADALDMADEPIGDDDERDAG